MSAQAPKDGSTSGGDFVGLGDLLEPRGDEAKPATTMQKPTAPKLRAPPPIPGARKVPPPPPKGGAAARPGRKATLIGMGPVPPPTSAKAGPLAKPKVASAAPAVTKTKISGSAPATAAAQRPRPTAPRRPAAPPLGGPDDDAERTLIALPEDDDDVSAADSNATLLAPPLPPPKPVAARPSPVPSTPSARLAAGLPPVVDDDDDGEHTMMHVPSTGSARLAAGLPPVVDDDDDDAHAMVHAPSSGPALPLDTAPRRTVAARPADDDDGERTMMHVSDTAPGGSVAGSIAPSDDELTMMHLPGAAPGAAAGDGDDDDRTMMHTPSGPSPAAVAPADELRARVHSPDPGTSDDALTQMSVPGAPVVDEDDLTHMRGSTEIDLARSEGETMVVDSSISVSEVEPRPKRKRKRGNRLADEALPKGSVIGRYVVVERIGTGGMGSVYAAYDPELDRKVAVKVLHSILTRGDAQAADARGRLLREAQALAKLQHPAVITVHDVGVFRGQVFMAMEFVEGITLKEWMKDTKRSWREIVKVFTAAGEGLAAAHAADLIHRDFKPTNVLISEDGRVRVLDFGLARRAEYNSGGDSVDGETSGTSSGPGMRARDWQQMLANGEISVSVSRSLDINLTQAGAVMGSPAYMAPEQHMSQPTEPRTDQFSFCVAMYEALYGTRPFISEDARMLIYAIMEGRLHKPPRDSGVPNWLRKVLLKGLAPDPNDRYPTMSALLADMARDPGRRIRRWLTIAGVVALVGVGGTAAAWPYIFPPEISEEANARIEELADAAHEAAAKFLFVYPPADAPEEPTAFGRIRELEEIDDATRELAQQRAQELRAEFAETLVGMGDQYWEKDGGKAFAIDYYAQALMFDDTNERASERASLTVGQLASLREKATKAEFTEGELKAAKSLAVLADTDEERKRKNLQAMLAEAQQSGASLTGQAQLELLAGGETAPPKPKPKKKRPRPTPEVPKVDFEADASDAQPSADNKKSRRDPKAAAEYAAEGQTALKATNWKEAEKLFHKALSLDRRNTNALIGLSDLHFDRSEYNMALTYAERAVAAAPKKAAFRIKLGDVYYKVLRYTEAKEAYEAAQQLGSASAESRLARIEKKLGG